MIHSFAFLDRYFLIDVESGAVHELDEAAYRVAAALERGEAPEASGLAGAALAEIRGEFEELRAAGAFDTPAPALEGVRRAAEIKSLCLHVAHDCNLRCKYCFASTGDFHGARMLMPPETARAALDFLIARSGTREHLEVDLFGGEPLMNLPVCREIVRYGRTLEKRFQKRINFTMTTNCVALDDEAIRFINEEMHNVVISLDGRQEVHDALRPTVNGKGSWELIRKNAKRLIAGRGDKEYYVRGTFTRGNLDFMQDVAALTREGFRQISIEPVVLPDDSPYAILPEHLPRVMAEYDTLAAQYIEARRRPESWYNFFHFMIDLEGGPCLYKRVRGCGAGCEYAAVTPDGEIYPCHQFVGLPEWKLGHIGDNALDEGKRELFAACSVLSKEACKGCWAKYYCGGGCMANACLYGGGLMRPHRTSCALMKKRIECAIGIHAVEAAR
ncbi:MAG: thioether cross-link-forming SCIFF peptide maturase [Clostridia bacterium]|nr:thioether cross-link-forming SCIFF peptide maturase [Clostridia bacterium]